MTWISILKNPQILNNLGVLHLDCNNLEDAERSFRKSLDNQSEYSEAHYNLGRVLLMAEKFTEGWEQSEWRWSCSEFPFSPRYTNITEWKQFTFFINLLIRVHTYCTNFGYYRALLAVCRVQRVKTDLIIKYYFSSDFANKIKGLHTFVRIVNV